jgi:hypothetical protein
MRVVSSRLPFWLVLLGVPFALRCGLLAVWRHGFPWGDGLFYAAIAGQLFQFGHAHEYLLLFPPGYPLLVALFCFVLSLDGALVYVSLLSGSVVPVLTWWIARQVGGKGVAWSAWVLTCCSPLLLGLSMERLADSLFIAWVLAALGSMLMFCRSRLVGWFAAFSFFSAFCVQTKPEGLVLAVVQSLICLLIVRWINPLRRLLLVGFLWVTIMLVGLPYWILLHQRTGVWMVSGKASLNLMHARAKAVAHDHSEELKIVYRQAFAVDASGRLAFLTRNDSFWDYLSENPGRALRVYWDNAKKGLDVFSPAAVPLVVAMCVGWAALWTSGRRTDLALLASPLVLLLFPPLFVSLAQPSFHPGRLAGPVVPSLVVLASIGLERIQAVWRRPRLGLWVLLAWALACLAFAWYETERLDSANRAERQLVDLHREQVSRWLAANTGKESVIASTSLLDDAYGGRRSVWLPWEETPRLVDYLRSRRVKYVLQERGGGLFSRGVEGLGVNPESVGLQPVASLDTVPPVVVYRCVCGP